MGVVHLNGPEDPRGKCVLCLARAKQVQWEQYQDDIKAGYAAPAEKVTWIPWPAALDREILDGPYRAVAGDAPHLGIIDGLCWDDIAGFGQPKGSIVSANGAIPPGLLKGKK